MRIAVLVLALALAIPEAFADELSEEVSYEAQFGLIQVGGFVVLFDTQGPMSYVTLTSRDLPRDAKPIGEVKGRGCQRALSIPLLGDGNTQISGALGDGGYRRAFKQILEEHPGIKGIYDVKIDDHDFSILGIYTHLCTEVTARGFM